MDDSPSAGDEKRGESSSFGCVFWFIAFVLGYILLMSAIPHGALLDGSPWHGSDCRMARRGLAGAIVCFNEENASPVVGLSASGTKQLIDGNYFRSAFCPSDPEDLQCSGGYMPDPPSERALWWYDKQLNLMLNGWVPLPLVTMFGGVSSESPGTFTMHSASGGVSISCSLHGSGTFVPYKRSR